ncbi:nitroreductase [Chloroflexota bacterium]
MVYNGERKEKARTLDIVEAIQQRRSVRAFKPATVPQEILREIMELALRAPSWANTQPWEFAIVGGKKLEEIRQAYIEKAEEPANRDIASPLDYPEPYDARRRTLGRKILEMKGIGRNDTEKKRWWQLQGLLLFEAPTVIYIYIDRSWHLQDDRLNVWPLFDCGLVAANIMLLATGYGLGTIPQAQAVNHPDTLRMILGIPDDKLIVLGIAIGYPDWDDPINQFRSEREPGDKVTRWYGFDYKGEGHGR